MREPTAAELALARAALAEITPDATVGPVVGVVDEGEGVSSVLFATTMPGYRGWNWTVSIAGAPGADPSVLETELMPGEGALLSPDWVPWSDRLTEYRAAQEAAALAGDEPVLAADGLGDDLDDDLDDDDDDDDDLDDDDLDGVDIESIEESVDDDDALDGDLDDDDAIELDVTDAAAPTTGKRDRR